MKTDDAISALLKGRGENFDAATVISNFDYDLGSITPRGKLLEVVRSRKYIDKSQFVAGCDEKTVQRQNEPAFSRALFNMKYFALNGELAIMLDYEVPLSSDSKQKVDILAYKPVSNTLVAIEYKIKPKSQATGVEYGLLESYCYGDLLHRYVSTAKNINKEIDEFLKSRLINPKEYKIFSRMDNSNTKVKTEFVLAGPVSYFSEYITKTSRSRKRFDRIVELEKAIKGSSVKGSKALFAGYLLISEISHKNCALVGNKNGKTIFPFMMRIIESMHGINKSVMVLPN